MTRRGACNDRARPSRSRAQARQCNVRKLIESLSENPSYTSLDVGLLGSHCLAVLGWVAYSLWGLRQFSREGSVAHLQTISSQAGPIRLRQPDRPAPRLRELDERGTHLAVAGPMRASALSARPRPRGGHRRTAPVPTWPQLALVLRPARRRASSANARRRYWILLAWRTGSGRHRHPDPRLAGGRR